MIRTISRAEFQREILKDKYGDKYRAMRAAGQLPTIRMIGAKEHFLESDVLEWLQNLPRFNENGEPEKAHTNKSTYTAETPRKKPRSDRRCRA